MLRELEVAVERVLDWWGWLRAIHVHPCHFVHEIQIGRLHNNCAICRLFLGHVFALLSHHWYSWIFEQLVVCQEDLFVCQGGLKDVASHLPKSCTFSMKNSILTMYLNEYKDLNY